MNKDDNTILYDILGMMAEDYHLYGYELETLSEMAPYLIEGMNDYSIPELLADEVQKFYRAINNEYYYESRINLFNSQFLRVYSNELFNKLISIYVGDINSYKLLPLFFHNCAIKTNLKYYDPEDYDIYKDYINRIFELTYKIDQEEKHSEICILPSKTKINENKYIDFYGYGVSGVTTREMASVYGECLDCNNMIDILKRRGIYNPENYVKWIAEDIGDGYGFDVYGSSPLDRIELLSETKTGSSKKIYLTENELRVAKETLTIEKCEYYINKYQYTKDTAGLVDITDMRNNHRTLHMNKDLGVFIEMDAYLNPIFYIAVKDTTQENGKQKEVIYLYTTGEYLAKEKEYSDKIVCPDEIKVLKRIGKL